MVEDFLNLSHGVLPNGSRANRECFGDGVAANKSSLLMEQFAELKMPNIKSMALRLTRFWNGLRVILYQEHKESCGFSSGVRPS